MEESSQESMHSQKLQNSTKSASNLRVAKGTDKLVRVILQEALLLENLSDEELSHRIATVRSQTKFSERDEALLSTIFSLGFEVIRRLKGITLHPCQVSGGILLSQGVILEMATGEGKTLTAVLPTIYFAMHGKGVHVVTTNDYLAERDADELKPIYNYFGLTVGCITSDAEPENRRQAYQRDITYATAKEIGFDFLRDRMTYGPTGDAPHPLRYTNLSHQAQQNILQRGLYAAIVDEVDSVMIDDARTPLIIGQESPQSTSMTLLYRWCHRAVSLLTYNEDYILHPQYKMAMLTELGAQKVLLTEKPLFSQGLTNEIILEHLERMLEAHLYYHFDKQYTVENDEIVLLDESTGRKMEGRKLQRGLHHCLEAKQGLPLSAGSKTASRITVQSFFRLYTVLAGMTGTAIDAKAEFKKIYNLKVKPVPTDLPCKRQMLPARAFISMEAKCKAIALEVKKCQASGRPVLVGTPSVSASVVLSSFLQEQEIEHRILNAHNVASEAEIISQAGATNCITIATNMAGRGTDIKLKDDVAKAGGLHVIATEFHQSARIDRQLVGRCARQGDPGTYQFMVSLDDELFQSWPAAWIEHKKRKARPDENGELPSGYIRHFKNAQKSLERRHLKSRKKMLKQEKKQNEMYARLGFSPYLETIDDK